MRIQQTQMAMQATSYSREKLEIKQERLKEEERLDNSGGALAFKDLFDMDKPKKKDMNSVQKTDEVGSYFEISQEDYDKIRMLEKILSYLTGKDVKFTLPRKTQVNAQGGSGFQQFLKQQGVPVATHRRSVSYEREQSMTFEAAGQVKTADGRTIDFSLTMARHESVRYESTELVDRSGNVVDPLVINYQGSLPNLTRNKYDFDLDFDGTSDQISFLTKGSGFLAFDRNEDGTINDGRELFGPTSGDGFKELSAYDEDGNGWIDEGDSIFDKLRIWSKDEKGEDVLFALGEVGIGAVYLGNVSSEFALGDGFRDDGYVRSTGMFLKENGQAGTIQHIDLSL